MGSRTAKKAEQQKINLGFKILNGEFTVNYEGRNLTFSYPGYTGLQNQIKMATCL